MVKAIDRKILTHVIHGKLIIKRAFSENELKGTKTGDEREYRLTKHSVATIDKLRRNTSTTFLFVRSDGRFYTNKDINKLWHDAENVAGASCKLQNAMRHSLACQLLDKGEDIETVRQIMGHTNIKMTMRYTHRRATPSANRALENRRVVEIGGKDETELALHSGRS